MSPSTKPAPIPTTSRRRSRVLLLLPTASYRAPDFLEAALRLGVDVTVASEEKNVLTSKNPAGYLQLDFEDWEGSAQTAQAFAREHPLHAVVGVDDATTTLAAAIAERLGLKGNPVAAVAASRNKRQMREVLGEAGVPIPEFHVYAAWESARRLSRTIHYPCVLKPTMLSGSQGVIRANDGKEFIKAWARIRALTVPAILVESFVAGPEVAVEAVVDEGRLKVLAIFDKPDPLDGPFFEETIYVRPSRHPARSQEAVTAAVAAAVKAFGLVTGPVHAEARLSRGGPKIIEVASRPIGGRCSHALRFGMGVSLEELVLRQALGLEIESLGADPTPSGVMMIPVPGAGRLLKIEGLDEARAVQGIEEIIMNAHVGEVLIPLPEGSRYPGFIFSRAKTPELAEKALREAHSRLKFTIEPIKKKPRGAGAPAPRG